MLPSGNDPDDCQVGSDSDRLDHLRSNLKSFDEARPVAEMFNLLGEPTRLRILNAIVEAGELSVGEIAEVVEASGTSVSQALRLLRSSGIVTNRKESRSVLYRLDNENVRTLLSLSLEGVADFDDDEASMIGAVERIAIAPESGEALVALDSVDAVPGVGLVGDRAGACDARQVSIQSMEELKAASKRFGHPILPDQTRRNITIASGELPRDRGQRLLLGEVELEVFSDAPPCDRITEVIGEGSGEVLHELAGIHCRVISGGKVGIGDHLVLGRSR